MSDSVVTIIGSINYDLVTYMDTIAGAGETKAAKSFETHFGGKGLNQAISVSKLLPKDTSKVKVQMCGSVGDDTFGPILKEYLSGENVNTDFIKSAANESTGVAVIVVEELLHGENRILITAGANGQVNPSEEDYNLFFPEDSSTKQFVILENETPNTLDTINWINLHRPNIEICYNPSPFKKITREIYSKIDILIVNETEALMCSENIFSTSELEGFKQNISQDKVDGFTKLAEKLAKSLNEKNANTCIITLGSKGAIYATSSDSRFFKSHLIPKENVVDTTGAGDTFMGGIISQLSLGHSIDQAMEFASRASSLTVQRKGAAEAVPYYDDVVKLIS